MTDPAATFEPLPAGKIPEPAPIVDYYIRKVMSRFPATPMLGRTAIDLGCGRGRNALALANRSFETLGIDTSPEDIKIAEDLKSTQPIARSKCHFLLGDILTLTDLEDPFDRPFSVVAANEVLHDLPKSDQHDLLRDMRRRTRPNGVHLVSGYVLSAELRDGVSEVQANMFFPGELQRLYESLGSDLSIS